MRRFAWLCLVVGLGVAIAVPIKAERELAAFVGSTDYHIWTALEDKRIWRPAGLRSAELGWVAVAGGLFRRRPRGLRGAAAGDFAAGTES